MTEQTIVPKWFTVTCVIALVWNMLGLMAFIGHIMITPEMIAELPENQQTMYENMPIWADAAFGLAVIAGTLGCVLLLLRKISAKSVLIVSLLAVIVQNIHAFIIADSIAVLGASSAIMPAIVIVVAMALIFLANKAQQNNWLN